MKKRILALVITIIMASSVLVGCTLVEHNYERDYRRVIVTIKPLTFQYEVENNGVTETKTYTSNKTIIRKQDLIDAYVNAGDSLSGYETQEAAFKGLVDQLINRKILVAYAEALLAEGKLIIFNRNYKGSDPAAERVVRYSIEDKETASGTIKGSLTDMNIIWRGVYDAIDTQIFSFSNVILSEKGDPERTQIGTADITTEFSTMPNYDAPEAIEFEDKVEFDPATDANVPTINDYLALEATARLVRALINKAEKSVLTTSEKTELKADKKLLDEILKETNGKRQLYIRMKEFFVVRKYFYVDQYEYRLLSRLQQYILEDTAVSNEEIKQYYTNKKNEQETLYNSDISSFESALEGTEPVFYYPTDGYFFVRQILIPFSGEQTAALEKVKQGTGYSTEYINNYREQLAAGITARSHESGNFEGEAKPFNQIYAEIKSCIEGYHHEATYYREREFVRLLYKYNTDPGAFDSPMGYLIKPDGNSWVSEFTAGARKMRNDDLLYTEFGSSSPSRGFVGALSEPILTDYGYHILYYAKRITPRTVTLDDYLTAGQFQKYSDLVETTLQSQKAEANYSQIVNNVLQKYKDDRKSVSKNESIYKDLWNK